MRTFSNNAFIVSIVLMSVLLITSCNKDETPAGGDPNPTPRVDVVNIIKDDFQGTELIAYANSDLNVMVAFNATLADGTTLTFEEATVLTFPEILKDTEGNIWNVFGQAVSGPRTGTNLREIRSFMGYWFSFAAFFPKVTLFGESVNERLHVDDPSNDWLVDPDFVFIGSFKDGIPALNQPSFIEYDKKLEVDNKFFLENSDLVIVIQDGDNFKVYPHKILDWHEVVNDVVANEKVVISFCPLTGTSNLWSRVFENQEHVFGVSGLLFNSNLILYDDITDSNWSQIKATSVNGAYKSLESNNLAFKEMNWEAAKMLSQNGSVIKVLSEDTGFSRDYDIYPYGDYRTNHNRISYPLKFEDDRVPSKERVLGVLINDKAKAFRFQDFE
ncbi:DUF3179 domain-containing (seleno)protein [Fulvivirgaceae bacterium BMA10]|uniref:DUF3179 domain-containing (Seleno)protein n=1 Tax=Splendidivirga corallicola TaxID=3051826 RepID=A0ABT8KH87_9BACT|nr:DUF3179 domain-containing (seleno)protein [Fulvivirgaceae bacterium BMA10]